MEAGVATTGSAAGANWLEGQGNTGWSSSSYHVEPRSATGDLGALAGPREITSPLAFHGEPSAAQKALPDVAQCPFPWVPPHAGLSRWAVSCPNRALRWRHENPAPGRPAPREGNTDRSVPSCHLKPRSTTENLGELAGPREISSPLAFRGEPPAARKALPDVAKRPFPCIGSPSRWAEPLGCGLPKPGFAVPQRKSRPWTPRLTGREHGQVGTILPPQTPFRNRGPGAACWPTRNLITTGFSW